MLDTKIIPGSYAYQFRVDVLGNQSCDKIHYKQKLTSMLLEEEFTGWICALEIGAITKKLHYQCIIWHKQKLTAKEKMKIKSKYFRKNVESTNSISFTSAKRITSLGSYCQKDINDWSTEYLLISLSEAQREKLPQWITAEMSKTKWKKMVESHMLHLCSLEYSGEYETCYVVVRKLISYYISEDHPPPSKYTVVKLLLKYHPKYTVDNYITDTKIFPEIHPTAY